MALKSTIYKAEVQISDVDRGYYGTHTLTIARHPSETDERMMVRLIAFILFANEQLGFGKGLSTDDEPDLWQKDLTDAIELWIDVGLPDEKRVRRACGRSDAVVVLTYGGRVADMWWQQNQSTLSQQDKLAVINLTPETTRALAAAAARGMQIHCTRQDGELWLTLGETSLHILPEIRHAGAASPLG